MTAPNLVQVAKIYLRSIDPVLLSSSGTPSTILTNTAGSNKVYKVNGIRFSNDDAAVNYDGTLRLTKSGGSAKVIGFHTVPAKGAVKFLDKSEVMYLEEGDSLSGFGSTANKLMAAVSYEEITDVP